MLKLSCNTRTPSTVGSSKPHFGKQTKHSGAEHSREPAGGVSGVIVILSVRQILKYCHDMIQEMTQVLTTTTAFDWIVFHYFSIVVAVGMAAFIVVKYWERFRLLRRQDEIAAV